MWAGEGCSEDAPALLLVTASMSLVPCLFVCFLNRRIKSCRSCAIVAEGMKDDHTLPVALAGPYSVGRTAAARAGTLSEGSSRGASIAVTGVTLLASTIHFYDILFLLGPMINAIYSFF